MASGCLYNHTVMYFAIFQFWVQLFFFGAGFLLPGMVLASRQHQGQASLRKWKNSSEGNGARSLADTRAMDSFQCFKSKGMYEAKNS